MWLQTEEEKTLLRSNMWCTATLKVFLVARLQTGLRQFAIEEWSPVPDPDRSPETGDATVAAGVPSSLMGQGRRRRVAWLAVAEGAPAQTLKGTLPR